jgi:hypothetical protein
LLLSGCCGFTAQGGNRETPIIRAFFGCAVTFSTRKERQDSFSKWRSSGSNRPILATLRGMTHFARMLALMPEVFAAVDAALDHAPARSLDSLRSHVRLWRDERYPHLTDLECERLVRCLNRNFYALKDC